MSPRGFVTIALSWALVFAPLPCPAPVNPYESPAAPQEAAETFLDKLVAIGKDNIDSEDKYRAVEQLIRENLTWWSTFERTMTLPQDENPFDMLTPWWRTKLSEQINRGHTVREIDALVKTLDPQKLAQLPVEVIVPLLALCDFKTIRLLPDVGSTNWEKIIGFSIIHKAGLALDKSRDPWIPQHIAMSAIGVVYAFWMGTTGIQRIGDIVDFDLQRAAVLGAFISLLALWGGVFHGYYKNRQTGKVRDEAREELEATYAWVKQKQFSTLESMKAEGWGTSKITRSKCLTMMHHLAEGFVKN